MNEYLFGALFMVGLLILAIDWSTVLRAWRAEREFRAWRRRTWPEQ